MRITYADLRSLQDPSCLPLKADLILRFLLLPFLVMRRALADVLTVSIVGGEDFTNLQAAVDAAQSGDTLRLAPGIYDGFHSFGKAIVLAAEDGAIATVESS